MDLFGTSTCCRLLTVKSRPRPLLCREHRTPHLRARPSRLSYRQARISPHAYGGGDRHEHRSGGALVPGRSVEASRAGQEPLGAGRRRASPGRGWPWPSPRTRWWRRSPAPGCGMWWSSRTTRRPGLPFRRSARGSCRTCRRPGSTPPWRTAPARYGRSPRRPGGRAQRGSAALRAGELARVLDFASAFPRAFLRDAAGIGTTFLSCGGGTELRPAFGGRSAARHLASGAVEITLPGVDSVRRDVDTGEDLEVALALGVGPHTERLALALPLTRDR